MTHMDDRLTFRLLIATASLIRYCKSTKDYLVPSVWGPVDKREDPYAPHGGGCECAIM